MTLRYVDGFEYIPTTYNVTQVNDLMERAGWFNQGSHIFTAIDTGTPFNFGKVLWMYGDVFDNGGVYIPARKVYVIPQNTQEGIIGVRVRIGPNMEVGAVPVVGFYDAINNRALITVAMTENGVIRVYHGRVREILLVTSRPGVYYDQDWFYLEVKAKIANVGGYVQVRINTEIVVDLVDADTCPLNALPATSPEYFDSVFIGGEALGGGILTIDCAYDDFYYLDLTGTKNNTYRGNVRVWTQFLVANGANIDFTPVGAATNWEAASNILATDAAYVHSSTPGDYDLYELQANLNSPAVHGVQTRIAARQDDATQRILHSIIKSGGTTDEGTEDHYLNQAYTYHTDIWELNPDTGAGWTGAEVNALEIGPKLDT